MHRFAMAAGLCAFSLIAQLPGTPALAVTAQQKMATCKFGADDQKLTGQRRTIFLKRCMSGKNDPRGPAPGTAAAPKKP